MSRLNGKVAVITGGSSGIGLATAQRFVDEGAYVFIMGRRQSELDKAEAVIGDGLTTVAGDVTSGADQGRARSGVGYGSHSHPKSTPTIGCRISTSITTDCSRATTTPRRSLAAPRPPYLSGYSEFDGIMFPIHRKVLPRGADNHPDPHLDREPVLIGMEFAGDYTLR